MLLWMGQLKANEYNQLVTPTFWMPVVRFHSHHGENIVLSDAGLVARRDAFHAHAICLGEKALLPGEMFLVEIEENTKGYSGHLRIGLTLHDPSSDFHLPQYTIPDLVDEGRSWIRAITKTHNRLYQEEVEGAEAQPYRSIIGEGEYVYTARGAFRRHLLKPVPKVQASSTEPEVSGNASISSHTSQSWMRSAYQSLRRLLKPVPTVQPVPKVPQSTTELKDLPGTFSTSHGSGDSGNRDPVIQPTDEGSRIGVMYVIDKDQANMHMIINGEDQGACARGIPYEDGPMFAVVDVYGTTKQVRIVQLYELSSLQHSCRTAILQHITKQQIEQLPLPTKLKQFLRYGT